MFNFLQEYVVLKYMCVDLLEKSTDKTNVINCLLKMYSESIKSRRITENINSAASLIKILEKRICLSITNIEPLCLIAKQLDAPDSLHQKIGNYKNCLKTSVPDQPNYYELSRKPVITHNFKETKTPVNVTLDELIYEEVSGSIGSSWKTMARYLSIPEGTIDKLSREHKCDMNAIVQNILNIHRKKYPNSWRLDLSRALEKSRRSDIKEVIENLIQNH